MAQLFLWPACGHKVPGKALTAFSRALKLARRSEWQQGAKELEVAVDTDPEFADAHGNLGVHYVILGQLNQAVAEFRRAIALDAATSMHHSNLALAYILLHRPNEAKTEAQTAVLLDSRNAKGQYFLGLLLARNPGERADAEKHLTFAAQEVPDAHLVLGKLYHAAGDESKATMELERYRKAISTFKENY
jgi:tetratricopeptide (TPR) repeat protein